MNQSQGNDPASRLARKLGIADAVIIGLGAMMGAGIFAVIGPATGAAGSGVLLALILAGAVAYCNAVSSAQLAARYPESGGTYVYGRRQLGHFWGYLAGWGFVFGKLASCTAMALTFGYYLAPELARPLAVSAVLLLTLVNYLGIRKTAGLTRLIVLLVLIALAVSVVSVLAGGQARPERLLPTGELDPFGILQAAGLWFFAFAGYARLATLGEEVRDPARVIPRAIPLALGITLVLYLLVAACALMALEADVLAAASAPLMAAVRAGELGMLAPVVQAGAAIACLGVLLSLIAGISRTAFAMSTERDLPGFLDRVHPRYQVPHRAEVAAGLVIAVSVSLAELEAAIGFSAFTVLGYYAITNAAAWTLAPSQRRWPRWLSGAGLAGCLLLAFSLPPAAVVTGTGVLASGGLVYAVRRLSARPPGAR